MDGVKEMFEGLCGFLNEVTEGWFLDINPVSPITGTVTLIPNGEGWVEMVISVEGKEFSVKVDAYGKTGCEYGDPSPERNCFGG